MASHYGSVLKAIRTSLSLSQVNLIDNAWNVLIKNDRGRRSYSGGIVSSLEIGYRNKPTEELHQCLFLYFKSRQVDEDLLNEFDEAYRYIIASELSDVEGRQEYHRRREDFVNRLRSKNITPTQLDQLSNLLDSFK